MNEICIILVEKLTFCCLLKKETRFESVARERERKERESERNCGESFVNKNGKPKQKNQLVRIVIDKKARCL
jgi:hypothetical protein